MHHALPGSALLPAKLCKQHNGPAGASPNAHSNTRTPLLSLTRPGSMSSLSSAS